MALLSSSTSDDESIEELEERVEEESDAASTGADAALLAAGGSVLLALYEFYVEGDENTGIFVGHWAPTILAFATFLKVKSIERKLQQSMVAGSTLKGLRKLLE